MDDGSEFSVSPVLDSTLKPIQLHEYTTEFDTRYQQEQNRITEKLGQLDMHHVGSTAVPGLSGKGIVDILVGLDDYSAVNGAAAKLNELGYITQFIDPEDEWTFLKSKVHSGLGDYHIHIHRKGNKDYQEMLLFRDYLRNNTEEAKRYAELKKARLEQSQGDRIQFTNLKTDYVQGILQKAGANNP